MLGAVVPQVWGCWEGARGVEISLHHFKWREQIVVAVRTACYKSILTLIAMKKLCLFT